MNKGFSVFKPPFEDWRNQGGMWADGDWNDLVEFLNDCASQPIAAKQDAELISPIRFDGDYRKIANALDCGGWLFLDVDTDGDIVRDGAKLAELGLEAYLYYTASHSADVHKYRILIPLSGACSTEQYIKAVRGFNYAMGEVADTSKLGVDGWFFIPAVYDTVDERDRFVPIHLNGGGMLSADEWGDYCPDEAVVAAPVAAGVFDDAEPPSEEQVKACLEVIKRGNPSLSYPEWRDVIFAVAYCMGAGKVAYVMGQFYPPQKAGDYEDVLASYDSTRSQKFGTLVHMAKQVDSTFIIPSEPIVHPTAPAVVAEPERVDTTVDDGLDRTFGMVRQKIRSGVPDNLWSRFEPAAWWEAQGSTSALAIWAYLSDKMISIGEPAGYFVRDIDGSLGWKPSPSKGHCITDANEYWGPNIKLPPRAPVMDDAGAVIPESDEEYIDRRLVMVAKFMNKRLVSLHSAVKLPIDEEFIVVEGTGSCLNTYVDMVMPYDDVAGLVGCLPLLRMIRSSLCAQEPFVIDAADVAAISEAEGVDISPDYIEMAMYIGEICGAEDTNFKWLIHWLARMRQRIGVVSGVALVLHGSSTGVGKNTLVEILAEIFGKESVLMPKAEEFNKDWSSGVAGGLICHCDDWRNEAIKKHQGLLKQFISNTTCTVNKRNVGDYKIINTASWLFTTNEEEPVDIDDNDRRYTCIHTTDEPDVGKPLAGEVYKIFSGGYGSVQRRAMLGGFNNLLCSIVFDAEFTTTPLENENRKELMACNVHVVEQHLRWMCDNRLYVKGTFTATEMANKFNEWHNSYFGVPTTYSAGRWGKIAGRYKQYYTKGKNSGRTYTIIPLEEVEERADE